MSQARIVNQVLTGAAFLGTYLSFIVVWPNMSAPGIRGIDIGYGLAAALATVTWFVAVVACRLKFKRLLNYGSLFFTSYFLFLQGQVLLFGLGVRNFNATDLRDRYPQETLIRASIFTSVCMLSLVHGAIIAWRRGDKRREDSHGLDQDLCDQTCWNVGKQIVLFSAIPFVGYVSLIVIAVAVGGYDSLQGTSSYASPLLFKVSSLGAQFFVSGVFLLLIGSKHDRVRFTILQSLFLPYPLMLLLLGERTDSTAVILITFYLRSRYFGEERRVRFSSTPFIGVALLLIFPAILASRHSGIISPSELVSHVIVGGASSTLVDSLAGIGYSLLPMAAVLGIVPATTAYQGGITYLAALTAPVPKLGFAAEHSDLSSWLQQQLHQSSGPGFSIPAEAFLNFGPYLAVFAVIALGYGLGRVLDFPALPDREGFAIVGATLFMVFNITRPRREIEGLVTDLFWVIIPVLVLLRSEYVRAQKQACQAHNVRLASISHQ